MSLQMHRFHQFHISLSAGLFLPLGLSILFFCLFVLFFLRLTAFTKDSIKKDECGQDGAAVFMHLFVCAHGTVV